MLYASFNSDVEYWDSAYRADVYLSRFLQGSRAPIEKADLWLEVKAEEDLLQIFKCLFCVRELPFYTGHYGGDRVWGQMCLDRSTNHDCSDWKPDAAGG